MTAPLNIEGLLFIIIVAIAVCAVLSFGPAAHQGDKGNALIWAAKHDHHDDAEGTQ